MLGQPPPQLCRRQKRVCAGAHSCVAFCVCVHSVCVYICVHACVYVTVLYVYLCAHWLCLYGTCRLTVSCLCLCVYMCVLLWVSMFLCVSIIRAYGFTVLYLCVCGWSAVAWICRLNCVFAYVLHKCPWVVCVILPCCVCVCLCCVCVFHICLYLCVSVCRVYVCHVCVLCNVCESQQLSLGPAPFSRIPSSPQPGCCRRLDAQARQARSPVPFSVRKTDAQKEQRLLKPLGHGWGQKAAASPGPGASGRAGGRQSPGWKGSGTSS